MALVKPSSKYVAAISTLAFLLLGKVHAQVNSTNIAGTNNQILAGSSNSFIGAGLSNSLQGSGSAIVSGTANAIVGSPNNSFIGGGERNFIGIGWNTVVVAGADNTNYASRSVIVGGRWNTIESNSFSSTISGGERNTIRSVNTNLFGRLLAATVSGGQSNLVGSNGFAGTIGGGRLNQALAPGATVPGGLNNIASGSNSLAAGSYAVASNTGTFVWSDSSSTNTFASSTNNQFLIRATGGVGINTNNPGTNALSVRGRTLLSGDLEVTGNILGNVSNPNAALSTVSASNAFTIQAGGNTGFFVGTNGTDASLLGRNIVAGHQSNSVANGMVGATIGGGGGLIESFNVFNQVSGSFGTVSGGLGNTAGYYATVGGGDDNRATGLWSTVPGGSQNVAAGQYSFAAGRQAQANNDGAFVWADSQDATFGSTGNNQFLIRAAGGVGINTTNPGTNALSVAGSAQITGTLQLATIQVLTGSTDPTNNAPNGSIYLRTGAAATNTLWIRAQNAWHPVTP